MRASTLTAMPEGFLYREDFLSEDEEEALVAVIRNLPFEVFFYKGYAAKRRVVDWGWRYDFTSGELSPAAALPEFLLPVRERGAGRARGRTRSRCRSPLRPVPST